MGTFGKMCTMLPSPPCWCLVCRVGFLVLLRVSKICRRRRIEKRKFREKRFVGYLFSVFGSSVPSVCTSSTHAVPLCWHFLNGRYAVSIFILNFHFFYRAWENHSFLWFCSNRLILLRFLPSWGKSIVLFAYWLARPLCLGLLRGFPGPSRFQEVVPGLDGVHRRHGRW